MDGQASCNFASQPAKRGRGRPRKTAPASVSRTGSTSEPEPACEEQRVVCEEESEDISAALERELEMAMQSPNDVPVHSAIPVSEFDLRDPDAVPLTTVSDASRIVGNEPKTKPIKKMSSTTRKMMKFGYSQVLRAAEPLTKGKVPGEKMAYIINNDEQAEAILDEILTELDQKYKVEQYFSPESKLAMFTVQLFMQARSIE